ncbi:MAG TPA: aminotransferase class IV [Polyangiales bacterium]
MEGQVCINGELCAAADAKISVFDRGFLYGDSAFEVMRTYGGEPFRERDHMLRLQGSCERLLIPVTSSLESWSRDVHRTIAASGLPECYVRVMVTRGSGPLGLDLAQAHEPSVLVFALPLQPPPPSVYEQGITVGLCHVGRAVDGTRAAGAKTSNYLASLLALHEVKQRGAAEAIVVAGNGEVVEGATSNVFVVRGGELITPPVEAGILAGITRLTVIELAARHGIPLSARRILPADLQLADEVFITSSVREVVPVVWVDKVQIGDGRPGPVTQQILRAYRELTQTNA